MREFIGLYRGKRIDNGEWVEGCLWRDPDLGRADISFFTYYNGENGIERDYDCVIVDPDTLGECTGLKDKNGKLIFEHQTIKYEGELYKVRMWCGMWCMFDKWEHYCELYKYAESGEIIGNIHNPELLKGGEQ